MMNPFRHAFLEELYQHDSPRAIRYRYALLGLDLFLMLFLVLSSFLKDFWLIETIDIMLGIVVATEFTARWKLQGFRIKFLLSWHGILDILVILSLAAPLAGEHFAFLRALRFLRLLRSYQTLERLRIDSPFFCRNEDVVMSCTNLLLFIFFMTALVYETQHVENEFINNYIDALYFTVTTLTTTGFGDITLKGDVGKLLAVMIMIVGVSLFIRLIQTVFRPNKVRHTCHQCGLTLHDIDAVHCKHCGVILPIKNEGVV